MAALLPFARQQFLNSNGRPLSGGKVWSYQAGTTIPKALFTNPEGTIPHTNPIILDSAGIAEIWMTPGSYKLVITDANDVVVQTIDKIKPADGGGGGILDDDYTFDAWSARFNEQFTSTGLMDTLTKIIKPQYVVPAIALAASGSGTVYEKGATVSSTMLTATVTRKSNPIGAVRFYQGATLLDTQTSGGAIPNGGASTFNYSTPFTDSIAFSAQVDDTMVGDDGPSTVSSNTVNFNFVYPYYVGSGAPSLSASSVAGLTKRVIASTSNRTESITALASEVFYFAYPASYGALTSILDVNNFETIGDWTLRTENITGLDGNPVSYRIYEFENPVVAGSYQYTFKR